MLNLDDLQSVEYPDMSWRRTGEDNPSNLQNVLPDLLPQTSFHAHGPLEVSPRTKTPAKIFSESTIVSPVHVPGEVKASIL